MIVDVKVSTSNKRILYKNKPNPEQLNLAMQRLNGIQRLLEVGMMFTCVFAFFMLLALVSFHPADPSWSQTGDQASIYNWVGPMGAWLADLLFSFVGGIAYLLPLFVALAGWFMFQYVRQILMLDYVAIGLRLIGIILLVLGGCGLASLNADDIFYFSAGGMVGDIISAALLPYFDMAGTILVLLCLFCTGFTLVSGISWLSIVDWIGSISIKTGLFVYNSPKKIASTQLPRLPFNGRSEPKNADVEARSPTIDPLPPQNVQTAEQHHAKYDSPADTEEPVIEPGIPDELSQHWRESNSDDDYMMATSVDSEIDDIPALTRKNRQHQTPKPAQNTNNVAPIKPTTAKVTPVRTQRDVPGEPLPSFELLERADKKENPISEEELEAISRLVEAKLADFNIEAKVVGVYPGPVITRFELDLAPGVKVSKITGLSKDLARAMSATSVRVVEVIPGKSVIGLELPNKKREMVRLSEVIGCNAFQSSDSNLTMVLGADISGKPVVVDLAKMPHLLVAGTTGSGKSVGVNVMILSLLYKSTPEDVRMIMIDPKMLELSVYEGIPHLLAEVVTDMKEAANALRWCVGEMERRYRLMSALGVRNLKGFNAKVEKAIAEGQPIKDPLWKSEESMETEAPDLQKLPSIVVVVDEFADMMMIVGKKVEELIARIAQKARAAGIHLVLATQRPSVDVITGLIKANIPTRIAFQVSSKIDSRTILDQQGAETLLGMGDMLYLPPGTGVPTRVHGAFVDDHEVHAVVADWKMLGEPEYIDEILNGETSAEILLPGEQPEGEDQELDAFYDEAVAFVTESRRASVSSVQRKFRIGYNRAARLVEQMELAGVVSAPGHNGNREVLAPPPPKD